MRCSSLAPKADDSLRRSRQSGSDSLGIWYWLRCDEADCRSYRWGDDYFHYPRPDPSARLLRDDEGARITERTPPREESNHRSNSIDSTSTSRRNLMRLRISALFLFIVISSV